MKCRRYICCLIEVLWQVTFGWSEGSEENTKKLFGPVFETGTFLLQRKSLKTSITALGTGLSRTSHFKANKCIPGKQLHKLS
jgi:hypothetical protein